MTRKDYIAIAAMIAANRENEPEGDTNHFYLNDKLTLDMADYMAQDNPNFDYDKFFEACFKGH